MASAGRTPLQHRVWRWHFIAGLAVVPFVVILAVTGSIYLFKPQFDIAVEQRINAGAYPDPAGATVVGGEAVLDAALAAHPGARLVRLVLPHSVDDPTIEAEIMTPGGARTLWIDTSDASILHDVQSSARFMNTVKAVHGTLLGGDRGSLIVETVACWTIILLVTGLFLWWPRDRPGWRVFIPSLASGRRETWRQVHGATGAWIGLIALIMLLSGLPWTQVWGEGFTRAKALAGLQSPGQEWFVTLQSSDPHALHDMGGTLWETETRSPDEAPSTAVQDLADRPPSVDEVVTQAAAEGFAPPVWVQPPRSENGVWTVRGMHPDRRKQETVHYDRWTGAEVMRIRFEDHNIADRAMALGVSFHEGALFGWMNQVLALAAALGVVLLSVTGTVMWWRRRPRGRLAVPPLPTDRNLAAGVLTLILAFCLFLPMAGVTLLLALGADSIWQAVRRPGGAA